MRKILFTMAMAAFLCNGCAWLGFGDDESVTAQTEAANGESSVVVNSEPEIKEATPSKAKKVASSKKASKKTEAQIREELDQAGKNLVAQSARTLLPNKTHKEVKKVGNEWVATYMHVDTEHVRTEMRTGAHGQYIGFIRYQEEVMECRGATKQAALSAPCAKVRARRMNELVRYDGNKWLN